MWELTFIGSGHKLYFDHYPEASHAQAICATVGFMTSMIWVEDLTCYRCMIVKNTNCGRDCLLK